MTGPDPYVPHRGSAAYRVLRYDLDLDHRPGTNAVRGTAVLDVVALEALDRLSLDLVGLGVDRVRVDGARPAKHRQRGGKLVVHLLAPVAAGALLVVEVQWSGHPAPVDGPWGEVGWEELTDGVLVAGQPDGAPTWFPCNDRPADKASYRLTVRTGAGYAVVAPGRLVEHRRSSSRTTWTYEQDEPTPTYLMTVQIGRYEEHMITEVPVPQRLWAPRRLRARARADTARSPEMLVVFERLFGPYPFADYSVVVTDDALEIPLEAQGLSVLGANHVDGAGGSERLVAHELAHQWFGNSLTVGTWSDIWLHEGPACYAEWLWSEASGGPSSDVLADRHWRRLSALPQDLVLRDPGPAHMFDDRVYERGALALHAVRRMCGDAAFFTLIRSWVAAHRHGTVTTDGLIEHVRREAGGAAADVLLQWVGQPALPARWR